MVSSPRDLKRHVEIAVAVGIVAPLTVFALVRLVTPKLPEPEIETQQNLAADYARAPSPVELPAEARADEDSRTTAPVVRATATSDEDERGSSAHAVATVRAGESRSAEPQIAPAAPLAVAAPAPSATLAPTPPPAPTRVPGTPVAGQTCGAVVCALGESCCNASCGICVPAGGTCSQAACAADSIPTSVICGPSTCNVGQVCCNASCGICTAPGGSCDSSVCAGPSIPFSEECGMSTCNVGETCCDASKGLCAPAGSCPKPGN